MITQLRRRLRLAGRDAGMSLIELMVAMVVFGILSAIVVSLYLATNKSVLSTTTSNQNTQAAGNIMNELSRVIRGATTIPTATDPQSPAVVLGTFNSLSLYSYVDSSALTPTPFLVKFTINTTTGQILEQRWPSSLSSGGALTFSSTASLTRTLPGRIKSGTTLFSYSDSGGDPLPATLGSGDYTNVASVTVTVVAQTSTNPSINPATLRNVVGMPNVTLEANN
jgi:prepilin-type N-terminal cleavage/methylation domain-containing protein